jgi:hypothetical protein
VISLEERSLSDILEESQKKLLKINEMLDLALKNQLEFKLALVAKLKAIKRKQKEARVPPSHFSINIIM